MKYIAHRGYWERVEQQNTFESIFLGLVYSDGVEIDLRMFNGEIIISHDSVTVTDKKLFLKDTLILAKDFPEKLWAFNIKEDGLAFELVRTLSAYSFLKYLCFDMSTPESIKYLDNKLKIVSRISDVEKESEYFTAFSDFYFLDTFYNYQEIEVNEKKNLFCISPDLHGKDYSLIAKHKIKAELFNDIYVCTDLIGIVC